MQLHYKNTAVSLIKTVLLKPLSYCHTDAVHAAIFHLWPFSFLPSNQKDWRKPAGGGPIPIGIIVR